MLHLQADLSSNPPTSSENGTSYCRRQHQKENSRHATRHTHAHTRRLACSTNRPLRLDSQTSARELRTPILLKVRTSSHFLTLRAFGSLTVGCRSKLSSPQLDLVGRQDASLSAPIASSLRYSAPSQTRAGRPRPTRSYFCRNLRFRPYFGPALLGCEGLSQPKLNGTKPPATRQRARVYIPPGHCARPSTLAQHSLRSI